jgi:CRP-like cAMP-binding protein
MPDSESQQSLGTKAARTITTTTKSVPQMQGISSRWLLRMLPWVQVSGGTYRVNRRLSYMVGTGRISFSSSGEQITIIPPSLSELPLLHRFDDATALIALAERFVQRTFQAGDVIVESGQPAEQLHVVVYGKLQRLTAGKYGGDAVVGVVGDEEHFGEEALLEPAGNWPFTVKALTGGMLLVLSRPQFQELLTQSAGLRARVAEYQAQRQLPQNKSGEDAIEIAAGHIGEPELPQTFADYETAPREYPLSVAQTVLQVHSRVADLYNDPMNQVEQQLRLTIEELRERQEEEMVNNREFGLLHNVDFRQRIYSHIGPPTPDDLDDMWSLVRDPQFFLAHPRTIAAFGRECNRRGIYPTPIEIDGNRMPAWRGIPILTCNKIPISDTRTSSILVLRAGEPNQGVVGLHQTGIPDEYQPSLSVRFMGVDEKAIISYLVSAYYSVAVLVPDALCVLENVEVGRPHE